MGNHISAKMIEISAAIRLNNNLLLHKTELDSYEASCKLDENLKTFHSSLQARTDLVINTLAGGIEVRQKIDKFLKTCNSSLEAHPKQVDSAMGEFEVRALSFDSLRVVIGCLLEMNEKAAKQISECKDIWKNPDLFELVKEYFDNSLRTLDFCTALEKCLGRARESQLLIRIALQQFEEEDRVNGTRYARTLEKLKNFEDAGDHFTEELIRIFSFIHRQHEVMLEKVELRKKKLDKKIKRIHAWRKVSSIVFAIAYASLLICSIVAAALAAPPVAQGLAAATSIPFGLMGTWIDSHLKNYEGNMKAQEKVVGEVSVRTIVTITELDNIQVLIQRLKLQIERLLYAADLAIKEEAVKIGIEEIKTKLGVFTKIVDDLGAHAALCSQNIIEARTSVAQRIIRPPNP